MRNLERLGLYLLVLIDRLEVIAMSPGKSIQARAIPKSSQKIDFILAKDCLITAHLYSKNQEIRKSIYDELTKLHKERLGTISALTCCVAMPALLALCLLIGGNHIATLAGLVLLSIAIAPAACILLYNIQTTKYRDSLETTYLEFSACTADRLFHQLLLPIMPLRHNDATPLSVLVCKDIYEQWQTVRGRSEGALHTHSKMSDHIIKTAYDILHDIDKAPLYDHASPKAQQRFKDELHKKHVIPLIRALAALADEFTTSRQELEQTEKAAIKAEMHQQKEAIELIQATEEATRQVARELADSEIDRFINGPL